MRRSVRCSTACPMRSSRGRRLARFELQLLSELGFGLDLATCAATGATDDLVLCVARNRAGPCRGEAGEPWKDRLLPLPAFLAAPGRRRRGRSRRRLPADRFLLMRHVLEPRGLALPVARDELRQCGVERLSCHVPEAPAATTLSPAAMPVPLRPSNGTGFGRLDHASPLRLVDG